MLLTNTFQAIHSALGPRGEMFARPSPPREVFALTALQAESWDALSKPKAARRPEAMGRNSRK